MKCFYHSADLDGKCSGAIVAMAHPGIELIGINYGDAFPWDRIEGGETVFMVDFSLQPFDDMERLNEICHLIWIDHHKTAIDEAAKRMFSAGGGGFTEVGRAGCELTWAYCMPIVPLPKAVFWLGRYDVWDHANHPGALELQYGMRLHDCSPENGDFWKSVFFSDLVTNDIAMTGVTLLKYEDQQNASYVKAHAFDVYLDGLRCMAINRGMTGSLMFKALWDQKKYDAMLSFVWRHGAWTISLYSDKPGIDVGAICKARGGGGHVGAAGFQCDRLPFVSE